MENERLNEKLNNPEAYKKIWDKSKSKKLVEGKRN